MHRVGTEQLLDGGREQLRYLGGDIGLYATPKSASVYTAHAMDAEGDVAQGEGDHGGLLG